MEVKYSQFKAMLAITKASLTATFRSPSAVVFSIGFPLIFILVFGFMGSGGGFSVDVALDKTSDTSNQVYKIIRQIKGLNFIDATDAILKEELEKGNLTAIIDIKKNTAPNPAYIIQLKSSEAVKPEDVQLVKSILNSVITGINSGIYADAPSIAAVDENVQKIPGRIYRRIDFILICLNNSDLLYLSNQNISIWLTQSNFHQ